jgi:hypothetical protein
MLLDRFILNTDYDSQKEVKMLELTLPVAEFNLEAQNTREFTVSATVDEGVYFENVFITNPEIAGSYTLVGGDPYVWKQNYHVAFEVYRSDSTHYTLQIVYINPTNATVTIPTNHTKAKVHLLVAAKQ